jgi:cyclopropane-fatty-acyl-phospholipid synthase
MSSKNEIWTNKLLEPSGIKINGSNPWDIKVLNENFYNRVKAEGSLGLGESYMKGLWDCKNLDQFFYKLLLAKIPSKVGITLPLVFGIISAKLFNLQAKSRAFEVGEKHYDLSNELFSLMLGKTMAYSCGYWKTAKNLDSAQIAKYDLICKKLNLKSGQKILDIGCGWGSFAKYAAENYEVSVVGITVSKEQAEFGKKLCKGLPVEIRLQDYRDLREKFDHIVSVGMFEHVGYKNYKTFLELVKNCLRSDGLFLLHTIGRLATGNDADPWTNKYIFPNGALPSLKQIATAAEKLFVVEDVHNFGADYDKTLMAWHKNFNDNWTKLKGKHSERFYRMWNYYLLSCAGAFRAREIQLWQIILSPNGIPGGYKSVR